MAKKQSITNLANLAMKKLKKDSPEQYQELSDLLQEQQRRKDNCGAKSYIPNGKAENFIKLVGSNEKFVNMFIGANGTSKTATGANIVTNILFGIQSEWFEEPLFQEWPYIKRGRIISDPTTIKEKIIPELRKWFPKNEAKRIPNANFEETKEGKAYVCKIITKTGWTIDVMSTEQDSKEFESVDLGFVWIDEPMPEAKFLATVARGRLGMIMFWTYTPLFHAAWIKRWMDDQIERGELGSVQAVMEDNCSLHGVRGFFKHKHIKRIADSFPEDEKEARVFGQFGHLIGRVHKKFRRDVHVIEPYPLDTKDWTTYKAIDPHPRVDDHVLYMSVNKKGTKIFSAELLNNGLVKRLYTRMKALESAMNFRIETRIIDPAAFVGDQHRDKEKDVGTQLKDLGETYIRGSKSLMGGIKRTNDALDYEEKKGLIIRPPEIYIFNTLPVLIKQLEEYVWGEHKGPTKDEKQPSGKPRDINDHQVENMHRLLMHPAKFINYNLREGSLIPTMADEEDNEFDPYA